MTKALGKIWSVISTLIVAAIVILAILLAGDDNSPVFDWQTHTLMPQVQQIIELYIAEYPDAVSTPTLQQFMALAAASNFKKSADIDTFIEQHILEQN